LRKDKRIIMWVLILSLIIFSCIKAKYQNRTAIIYAFGVEGKLLRSQMALEDSVFISGRIFWLGKILNKKVAVVNSGIGMTNAALTTQLLIDKYKPKEIIFTGICGGIDPANRIGDIVVPERWASHDFGYYDSSGFSIDKIPVILPGKNKIDTLIFFDVDGDLFNKALKVEKQANLRLKPILDRIPQIRIGGNGASGNSFIDQMEKRIWLKEKLDAQIVDMESAGAVQVANINGVPILAVRSCSDLAGGSGSSTAGAEMEAFMKVAADNSADFVMELLKSLDER
jgi:adenosylhomocysteine nucleosidase